MVNFGPGVTAYNSPSTLAKRATNMGVGDRFRGPRYEQKDGKYYASYCC